MPQNSQPPEPIRQCISAHDDKIDGPQVKCTGDKFGLFRVPTTNEEYASCERRFDWLQSEKDIQERLFNQLELGRDVGSARCLKPGQDETRITNALNQIEREMSALRLVMKKYTNDKRKFRRLKN
ncbi:unnamed protein product [Rodentolepis nana]|uniref:Uncharacterized protein n=1 Tax=Rodentolepis nana TaxID=102285 RepID=A0A3P7V855_RODNA|nr:unnamed protein product [Rodentolepis nana]